MHSSIIALATATSVVAAGSVPAISRPLSQLIHNQTVRGDLAKRQDCLGDNWSSGYGAEYICCDYNAYCLSDEYCVTIAAYATNSCCPLGTTYDSSADECMWSDGEEQEPYNVQVGPPTWDYNTYTTNTQTGPPTPLSYYETICTISYTNYYDDFDYALETDTLTSEATADTSTLAVNTNDEGAASAYFTAAISQMSWASTSWASSYSMYLVSEGVYPANVVTLGGASATGAPPASVTPMTNPHYSTFQTGLPGSVTPGPSPKGVQSGSAEHSATASAGVNGTASSSAAPSSNPSNAAGALRVPGAEMLVTGALVVFALGSGLSAVLL